MSTPTFEAPPEPTPEDGSHSAPVADAADKSDLTPDEMRAELSRARKDAAKYRTELRDATGKLQAFEDRDKTEAQKRAEEVARWQTEAERWRTTSVSSTIKALAATDFEYPDDAVGALDPTKYLDAGGTIDEAAIKTDLNALLDARPKWRRGESDTQTPRAPRPNTAQGASNGQNSSDPAQQFASIMQAALK